MTCVPLCGADRVYGREAEWWRHETLCPARRFRNPNPVVDWRNEMANDDAEIVAGTNGTLVGSLSKMKAAL